MAAVTCPSTWEAETETPPEALELRAYSSLYPMVRLFLLLWFITTRELYSLTPLVFKKSGFFSASSKISNFTWGEVFS